MFKKMLTSSSVSKLDQNINEKKIVKNSKIIPHWLSDYAIASGAKTVFFNI